MATARPPLLAAYFVGVMAADADALDAGRAALSADWGAPWTSWGPKPFDTTEYYREELGPAPLRAFYGFAEPLSPGALAAWKLRTNAMETALAAQLACPWKRPVNLDPGYLTRHNLVLASAKNYAHRIYLSDGIYAEVTRLYRDKRFHNLPWTFPDYASGAYDAFFLALRRRLIEQTTP